MASTALTLKAEAEAEFLGDALEDLLEDIFEAIFDPNGNFEIPIISDVEDANEAINEAIEGIIDGVCYKDAYLAEPKFDSLVCPDGFERKGLACLEICEEKEGDWKEHGLTCARCGSKRRF